jgi:hypothetical protein
MTALAKWTPFRELETFQNHLTTLFGRPLWRTNGDE